MSTQQHSFDDEDADEPASDPDELSPTLEPLDRMELRQTPVRELLAQLARLADVFRLARATLWRVGPDTVKGRHAEHRMVLARFNEHRIVAELRRRRSALRSRQAGR